ncbi:hypothetical protein VMT65_22495 [Nocardia sp. CDC153]|uniref:hypothetical protein n=1 Tax=Nocardia sp. CDC153 TaxID=3112167 RepID=UPI002DB630EA|nr:hypothetical protein [Nocardia sp. CDC153]MEC3955820.1 hypothetical protein [Nocardia sp. CDC153]
MTGPYAGEFPDFEQFMIGLLTPIAPTVSFLPAQANQISLPLIWVRTTGGTLDVNAITYKAHVQAVVFHNTRPLAQTMAIQVRDAFLNAPSNRVNGVLVDYVEEISAAEPRFSAPNLRRSRGMSEFPDLDPLNQMVELAFAIDARRQ